MFLGVEDHLTVQRADPGVEELTVVGCQVNSSSEQSCKGCESTNETNESMIEDQATYEHEDSGNDRNSKKLPVAAPHCDWMDERSNDRRPTHSLEPPF
jgi:hypothetical protein